MQSNTKTEFKAETKPEPKLDAPGKGLPLPDRWILKILAPWTSKRTPWDVSTKRFNRLSEKILQEVEALSEVQLNERILVPPIKGLEDSSRYWSIGMTLEHLMITGSAFKHIVLELSQEKMVPIEVRIEKVKPPIAHHTADVVARFKAMAETQTSEIETKVGNKSAKMQLKHPWFGSFNAHQWYWIMAVHQGIHFKQIQEIKKQLSRNI